MDAPSDANLHFYRQEMLKEGVKWCVRVCEPTYKKKTLELDGITVYDWMFPDGDAPPEQVIIDWLELVDFVFSNHPMKQEEEHEPMEKRCIAVHCVAGLGRAPVLVAIALIEAGMSPLDAVLYVRERRRGAINNKQLRFLEQQYRKRSKRRATDKCVIM